MAKTCKSISELHNAILKKAQKAVEATRNEIYNTISDYIMAWYGDYSPTMYERTHKFAESLVKLDAVINGSSISAEVKIDEGYLAGTYSTGNNPTGRNVAETAATGYHGARGVGFHAVAGNVRFWQEAIDSMGGIDGIKAKLIGNMKKYGL